MALTASHAVDETRGRVYIWNVFVYFEYIFSDFHIPSIAMSTSGNILKVIKEGKAQLQIPKTVFYNPVQEFNRDLSVLVLKAYLKYNLWHHKNEEKHITKRGGIKILDALSASGLRSIRYAKELGPAGNVVKQIVANDLSEAAVKLIEDNIKLNNVESLVTSSLSDAAQLMYKLTPNFEDRFHVIDLDPFGTGAQFFDAAVNGIGEAGLLMVTCTDTAVLCGNASESCFARYGSMSLRADFCHEMALRIILRSIESHAAIYGRYVKPLLSVSADFYVRLFMQVFTQQAETKRSASKLSQVYLCKECKSVELNSLGTCKVKDDPSQAKSKNISVKYSFKPSDVLVGDRCSICGGKYSLGGPIWSNHIHDDQFLDLLKQELALPETPNEFATFRRMEGLIHMCSEELNVPLFHSIDGISSALRCKMPKTKEILSALTNAGYKASLAHTNKTGFKTDAPNAVVWDIFCQLAERQNVNPSDGLAARILGRPREKVYDFTHNPAIEIESKKLSLLRFQMNPTREWGPKPRPGNKNAASIGGEAREDSFPENEIKSIGGSKRQKLSPSGEGIDSENR